MTKNKLNNINPFNDFVFKSCYYHQLITGLSCLGIEKDGILLNSFLYMHENFETEERTVFTERALEKALGYGVKRCRINQKLLVKSIDHGSPIIVGVDSYYLSCRAESYRKYHDLHFILVYGYDIENDAVNVIEHNYRNGKYIEKIISWSNIIEASTMLGKTSKQGRRPCRILFKTTLKKTCVNSPWDYVSKDSLHASRLASKHNLSELKRMFSRDTQMLAQSAEKIEQYLKNIKSFYFALSKTEKFTEPDPNASIIALISAYNTLVTLLWKMNAQNRFENDAQTLEKILRRIDKLDGLEEEVYGYITEKER